MYLSSASDKLLIAVLQNRTDYCNGFQYIESIGLVAICAMIKHLKLPVEFVVTEEHKFGMCNMTYCNGSFELLRQNKAHIAAGLFTPTFERMQHADLIYTTFVIKHHLMHRENTKYHAKLNFEPKFKQPFDYYVIMLLLITLFLFSIRKVLKMKLTACFQSPHDGRITKCKFSWFFESCWLSICTFVGHMNTTDVIMLVFSSFLHMWYYAGSRGQILLTKPPSRMFPDLAQLHKLVITEQINLIQDRQDNILFVFRANGIISQDKLEEMNDIAEVNAVGNGFFEILCGNPNVIGLASQFFPKIPPCTIIIQKHPHTTDVMYAFGLAKNDFPYKEKVKKFLNDYSEHGLMENLQHRMMKNNHYVQQLDELIFLKTVTLKSLKYQLIFVIASYLLSALCCLVEILSCSHVNK